MKYKILLILASLGITAVYAVYYQEPIMHSARPIIDIVSDEFIIKEAKVFEQKYNMKLTGIGGGVKDNKIWLISASFEKENLLISECDARNLIIACANEFIEAANVDNNLIPYLNDFPFTHDNLKLSIHLKQKNGKIVEFPNISIVNLYDGNIGYYRKDPKDIYKFKTEKYEPYEEAVRILQRDQMKE